MRANHNFELRGFIKGNIQINLGFTGRKKIYIMTLEWPPTWISKASVNLNLKQNCIILKKALFVWNSACELYNFRVINIVSMSCPHSKGMFSPWGARCA